MILTILRILFLRLRNNPLELLLLFVMPIAFFSIFAAIFSNGISIGTDKKLRVGWIASRDTALGQELRAFLEANSSIECSSLLAEPSRDGREVSFHEKLYAPVPLDIETVDATILVAQRSGRYDLIIKLLDDFPEALSHGTESIPCQVHLVTDGQNPMAVALVSSTVQGFFIQKQAALIAQEVNDLAAVHSVQSHICSSEIPESPRKNRIDLTSSEWRPFAPLVYFPFAERSFEFVARGVAYTDPARNPARYLRVDLEKFWLINSSDSVVSSDGAFGLPQERLGEHSLPNPMSTRQLATSPFRVFDKQSGLREESQSFGDTLDWQLERVHSTQGLRYLDPVRDTSQTLARAVRYYDPKKYHDLKKNPALNVICESNQLGLIGNADIINSVTKGLGLSEEPVVAQLASRDWYGERPQTASFSTPVTTIETAVSVNVENPQSSIQENPRIAMYAAGIVVLFVLFSATGNAAALLEEAESGTLDRMMVGKAKLFHIVGGKWLGIFLLGFLQISVMFLWADLIFKIRLWQHLPGFLVMTICTAAATSSFAMLLATIVRSRSQLNAASVVLILSMSAVGGSMIPRFVMSDRLKEIGKWTFNGWALDGYQKVFWYQSPISSLQMEVTVLLCSAVVFGALSLLFSLRWKHGW